MSYTSISVTRPNRFTDWYACLRCSWRYLPIYNPDLLTRGCIDALSYDFYPLQGLDGANAGTHISSPRWDFPHKARPHPRVTRISTLEIAIKAQAKRFLAHPLVVQHLEAIWAGSIVFHSAADNLHRTPSKVTHKFLNYGTVETTTPAQIGSPDRYQALKRMHHLDPVSVLTRRSVTLYDPKDASLFKLSRLRVPRYRQFLSTCSFAILLGLFVAILMQRSLHITPLEVVFWIWSAGFMLDEIVGFNEQGFGLYIMSFWNTFDLGILVLLICYYCMRLYGILMPDLRKRQTANLAYDFLAANSVLLFPRLFSVLDHYRYFSQLLIAFRMMAADLIAVFILIIISLSGFAGAFFLGFGNDQFSGSNVAFFCFQMVMGFVPAAWERWSTVNVLGKGILVLFLFVCHFLIVTILITVLTNSFMAVVQNANDEHQFVFAVNTISMVKSDALFSYVAPTNVIAWLLAPLRFVLPFRQFVRLNRTVIKATHFPVLFAICAYEKIILRRTALEPTEAIEQRGRDAATRRYKTTTTGLHAFTPSQSKLREPSVATFYKDRALDEVFRRPFRGDTIRKKPKSRDRRTTSHVVDNWMQNMGSEGTGTPPAEQDPSVLDTLENRRPLHRYSVRRRQGLNRDFSATTMSIASDPENFIGRRPPRRPVGRHDNSDLVNMSMEDVPEQTDDAGDGDDELITNDDLTVDRSQNGGRHDETGDTQQPGYFRHKAAFDSLRKPFQTSLSIAELGGEEPGKGDIFGPLRRAHGRNYSTTTTVLYKPKTKTPESSSSSSNMKAANNSVKNNGTGAETRTPGSSGRRTPKRLPTNISRARPIMPPRSFFQTTPNIGGMLMLDSQLGGRRRSFSGLDIASDLGDNKAIGGALVGGVPASFATQNGFATNVMRAKQAAAAEDKEDQRMMSKLMLARMKTLEEGFSEVLKEVKDWRREESGKSTGDDRSEGKAAKRPAKRVKKDTKAKTKLGRSLKDDWEDDDTMSKGGKGSPV